MLQDVGKIFINLKALIANYHHLQTQLSKQTRVGAVLKANAFGLGDQAIAKALYAAGCRDFFVAKPVEGVGLGFLPSDARIYILNGYYASKSDLYLQHRFIPVIGSFVEVEGWAKLCQNQHKSLPCYLKFNTGMNRLGFGSVGQKQLCDNLASLKDINVLGIMSHLANAEQDQHQKNSEQLERFEAIAKYFPKAEKSLANSSGIFLGTDYHYDLVRSGAALYGINPTPDRDNPMQHVVTLNLPIIRTRLVYQGADVGYGTTWQAKKDAMLATVGAGYADGIFRALSNKGKLYWRGHACPIVGKISMDLTTVDISSIPEGERPSFGDFLQLFGDQQSVDALAADAGTIGYEILTSLGQRYERIYV